MDIGAEVCSEQLCQLESPRVLLTHVIRAALLAQGKCVASQMHKFLVFGFRVEWNYGDTVGQLEPERVGGIIDQKYVF